MTSPNAAGSSVAPTPDTGRAQSLAGSGPTGPVPEANRPGHHPEIEQDKPTGPPRVAEPTPERFEFAVDPVLRWPAMLAGITPWTAHVDLTDDHVDIRFGLWSMRILRSNIISATVTGPYSPIKVVGPARLSRSDRGVTFATTGRTGVCLELRHPQPAIEPVGLIKHPGVTVTVADPTALVTALGF